MDFSFINQLQNSINTGIFGVVIESGKALAFIILALRMVEAWSANVEMQNSGDPLPTIKEVVKVFSCSFVVFASDFILNSIESMFSSVNVVAQNTSSDAYNQIFNQCINRMMMITEGADTWYKMLSAFLAHIVNIIFLIIALLMGALCKIADLSVTAGYLIQRVFLVVFIKFLFPLAVAFSTFPKMENLFWGWVKRYIGVFVLGIAYIGIINFTNTLGTVLASNTSEISANESVNAYMIGFASLVAIIVTLTAKIKLFQSVTSWVWSYFN